VGARLPVDKAVFKGDASAPSRDYDGCAISAFTATGRARCVTSPRLPGTGDSRYAARAREILLAYAARYHDYPLHNTHGEPKVGGAGSARRRSMSPSG